MRKTKWLSMVQEKFPTQMEILSGKEVTSGVRELSEGVLKYEGDWVSCVRGHVRGQGGQFLSAFVA